MAATVTVVCRRILSHRPDNFEMNTRASSDVVSRLISYMSAPELNDATCFFTLVGGVVVVVVVDDEVSDETNGVEPRRIVSLTVGSLANVCIV